MGDRRRQLVVFGLLGVLTATNARASEQPCRDPMGRACTQPELSHWLASAVKRIAIAGASTTIDLTLSVARAGNQIEFTIGVENALDGSPVAISGYTLDYSFDDEELAFAGAEQLTPFPIGTIGFTPPNDCTSGRCTAGNILGVTSDAVGPLFRVTFDVIEAIDDGFDDFSAGILDPVFDDVSQPLGQPVFAKQVEVVAYAVPEPGSGAAAGLVALSCLVLRRRRAQASRSAGA